MHSLTIPIVSDGSVQIEKMRLFSLVILLLVSMVIF
jgi:hypothetical protein